MFIGQPSCCSNSPVQRTHRNRHASNTAATNYIAEIITASCAHFALDVGILLKRTVAIGWISIAL
jgi:hypothetical protein